MRFHIIKIFMIIYSHKIILLLMSAPCSTVSCPEQYTTLHHMAALLLDRVFSCDIQALYRPNVNILISGIQGNYTKRDIHTREICDVSQHTLEYT